MSKTTDNVAIDFNGKALAVKGYDIVAYFTGNDAIAGSVYLSVIRDGTEYRFSTEANRDAFVDNPDRYLPQYGGFCAFGISEGVKLDVDPAAFRVVEDKLYLNNSIDILNMWLKDTQDRIPTANGNWPELRDQTS